MSVDFLYFLYICVRLVWRHGDYFIGAPVEQLQTWNRTIFHLRYSRPSPATIARYRLIIVIPRTNAYPWYLCVRALSRMTELGRERWSIFHDMRCCTTNSCVKLCLFDPFKQPSWPNTLGVGYEVKSVNCELYWFPRAVSENKPSSLGYVCSGSVWRTDSPPGRCLQILSTLNIGCHFAL